MISCHQKNSGIRYRRKQIVNFSQFPEKRLTMKKVTGYKQQIHRILADTHNDPAECFPDFFFPLMTPRTAPVRDCPQMYI